MTVQKIVVMCIISFAFELTHFQIRIWSLGWANFAAIAWVMLSVAAILAFFSLGIGLQ